MPALDPSVLRIIDDTGKTFGTGFLLAPDLAVTCAHVVQAVGAGPGKPIRVQPYGSASTYVVLVLAEGYSPRDQEDVAFLSLQSPIPGCVPLRLVDAELVKPGANFTSLGFSEDPIADNSRPFGVMRGLVIARNGTQLLQLVGSEIYRGMSGAPVLDQYLERVVGMISQGWDDKYERVAYAVPSETLKRLRPGTQAPAIKTPDRPNVTPSGPTEAYSIPPAAPASLPIPETEKRRARREGDRLWIRIAPEVEIEFVRVPEGDFWMGSDPRIDSDSREWEQPQHKVWLDEYWIGRYPITCIQYAAFLKSTGKEAPKDWKEGRIPPDKEDHPVVNVFWKDAAAFCKWSGLGLPTEAQWEKAARGTDGRIYPWGNYAPGLEYCNIKEWYGGTTPVGQFSTQGDSPYGCADMAGNVWEWCLDWYGDDYYRSSPNRNPSGPMKGEQRVLRGGSWLNYDGYARCSYRLGDYPYDFDSLIGFRVVVRPVLPSAT